MDGCDGAMGGAGMPCYNTLSNTMGVGDVVPATANSLGSGDLLNGFGNMKLAKKRPAPVANRNTKPFVSQGSVSASDMMAPRPMYVPLNRKK